MPLKELVQWVAEVPYSLPEEMRPMAESICESFAVPAKRLLDLGLSYLSLDRAGSTLSTGERQRMQLARAVRNRTTGVLYVLDEPSIGLHPTNNVGLISVMNDLVRDGNSVLLVDHDIQILKAADWLIEMGPEAGAKGGEVIAQGTKEDLEKVEYLKSLKTSKLREDLKGYRYILTFDGEPQGIGMFQGLSEIDRDEEYIESLEDLFKELEIPEEVFIKNTFTTSYFTEKGLEKFKSAIDTLQGAYRDYSGFDIELVTEDIPEDKIVYQDEYQIIVKGIKEGENIFETLNKEIERYL